MSADLNALGNLWETTPEPTEQTRASARARLFAAIAADAKTVRGRAARVARRRSRRRLVLGLAAGVCVLAAGGTAIAAGLGAFSGHTTIADLRACDASTIALTTGSGAQVLTGHTDLGVYCVAYKDTKGAVGWTAAKLGETPVGQAVAGRALDTASNTYVIFGVVPVGYTTLTLGSVQIPIVNQAFVVDPKLAVGRGVLSGPAGRVTINLSEFAT
jgi:hypothetical protein